MHEHCGAHPHLNMFDQNELHHTSKTWVSVSVCEQVQAGAGDWQVTGR